MSKPNYDSTVARIAGNILSGLVGHPDFGPHYDTVARAVALAREIVRETKRTEPALEDEASRLQGAGTRA